MRLQLVMAVMLLASCGQDCAGGLSNTPFGQQGPKDAGPRWKQSVPDPGVAVWRSVWAERANLAWVVGDKGAIMRFDGDTWTRVESGTQENLESVWARSESDIWAVGWKGTVLHSTGGDFSVVPSVTDKDLMAVFGSREKVFMVGARGVILTQDPDGGVREMVDETTLQTFDVCETRSDIYVTTEPICPTLDLPVLDEDGGFVEDAGKYPVCNVGNCCGDTPLANDDPMACCYAYRCDPDGGVLTGRIGVDDDLKAGWARGNFAVACGAGGSIYEYGEMAGVGKWTERTLAEGVPFTRDNLASAWGVQGTAVCAGQDGVRMVREGNSWRHRDLPTPVYVQGLWSTGYRDQYAVGFSGVLLRYIGYGADAGWFQEPVTVRNHLRSITGALMDPDAGVNDDPDGGPAAARVFVVGSGGLILQRD